MPCIAKQPALSWTGAQRRSPISAARPAAAGGPHAAEDLPEHSTAGADGLAGLCWEQRAKPRRGVEPCISF